LQLIGVDAVNTFRVSQVLSRTFTSFRVRKFRVSTGQRDFYSGFRQLHQKGRMNAALLTLQVAA